MLSKVISRVLVRFFAVGVLNTLFGYGCFAFFLYVEIHYSVALLMATLLGVAFNFKSLGVLVFDSNDNRLVYRFVAVYSVVYIINVSVLRCFEYFGVGSYLAGAIAIIPMALLAFLLNKKYVFGL